MDLVSILKRLLSVSKGPDGNLTVNSVVGGSSPQFVNYPPHAAGAQGETEGFGDRGTIEEQQQQQAMLAMLMGQQQPQQEFGQ